MLFAALLLGSWIDHRNQAKRVALLEQQVALLKLQVNSSGGGFPGMGFPVPVPQNPFETAEAFLRAVRNTNTRREFMELASPFAQSPRSAEAVPLLVELIDEENDDEIRARALMTLAWIAQLGNMQHDDVVVAKLIPLLNDRSLWKDESVELRFNVFGVLREMGKSATSAVPALRQVMLDDSCPAAALAAVTINAIDPSVRIGDRLSQLLDSECRENREVAAQCLVEHVLPDIAERLLTRRHAREQSPHVRERIAGSLNQLP